MRMEMLEHWEEFNMTQRTAQLMDTMIAYDQGDPKRIQHFLKVYAFAQTIGRLEELPKEIQEVLELAAIVHDVGIRNSLLKYHSSAGTYQEIEGPPVARKMLTGLGFLPQVVERVCFLVSRHHTYTQIDGLDYQILVEADFLVNLYEEQAGKDAVAAAREQIFRTKTGRRFLDGQFPFASAQSR